jgi:hypothetical protein
VAKKKPFPAKPLYGGHRLDLVMIRPPGIDNGAFVVTPDSVWYTRVCSFSLPLHKPTLGPNRLTVLSCRRWKHMTILGMVIIDIIVIIVFIALSFCYSIIAIIVIMQVITIIQIIDLIAFIQVGWDQLVHALFTSLTTKSRLCT